MTTNESTPFSFSGRIIATACIATIISNTFIVIVLHYSKELWLSWLIACAFSLLFLTIVLHTWLKSKQDLLAALENGLNNFAEQHFSTSIYVKGNDEFANLARIQNRLGDVLRRERQSIYQRELLLDTVMQAAPTALVLCDEQSRVVYSNPSARILLNDGKALNGRKLKEGTTSAPQTLQLAIQEDKNGLLTLDDHQQSSFHLTSSRFTLNTKIHRLYLIKQLTQEINRQEVNVWKKVIRLISHEINNSLAPISSLAHSGLKLIDKPKPEMLQHVFHTIGERSEHLNTFIQGYARFARLPTPQHETVSLHTFFSSLQQLISFNIKWQTTAKEASFDPAQIQQALLNLLKNAHESGSPSSDINITIQSKKNALLFAVEDNGPGMNEELFSNALLPFYSTKKSGTGLGLPLCREIIDAHNGHIQITNRDSGGLRVSVTLPRA